MSEQKTKTTRRRVLSGIQPTGEAHLGNYLGALRQWVHMQDENECFYCIVDQHAILGESDPLDLPQRTLDMAVSLLAVGGSPLSLWISSFGRDARARYEWEGERGAGRMYTLQGLDQ